MKFKLDENFGMRTQQLFRLAGYDIHTIREQKMQGCSDEQLSKMPVEKRLWIVEVSRIRVHQSEEDIGVGFEDE